MPENNIVERIADVLTKAKVFQFLTVDGDKPRGRPFSFFMVDEGRIIFGTGIHKDCYKQIQANPNVEVLAFGGGEFVRYDGEIEYVDDPAVKERAFREYDFLQKLYNENTGLVIRFFTLKNATAEFSTPTGDKKEKFNV